MSNQTTRIVSSDARAQCVAVVGRVGMGKSYVTRILAEQVLDDAERICIIDPTGVWWGLRLGTDGKTKGYSVVVFGGDYADVRISDQSGGPVAQLLAENNLPAVLDLSEFTIAERTRFLTEFLDTLYRANRKRIPITLVVDEADMVAPQRIQPDQTKMFSRLEQIVRRGRVRGFRPWLITQRPAELNKSVLSQAGTLIALGVTSSHDREAIERWVKGHGQPDQVKEVMGSLAGFQRGEGWVWTPAEDVLKRVKFGPIRTYDSMRTPGRGKAHPMPKALSKVDLTAVQESLKAVEAERAANDPKLLRAHRDEALRQVHVLGKQLERASASGFTRAALDKARTDGEAAGRAAAFKSVAVTLRYKSKDLTDWFENMATSLEREGAATAPQPAVMRRAVKVGRAIQAIYDAGPPQVNVKAFAATLRSVGGNQPSEKMGKAERLILTAIAQYTEGRTKVQAALLAGYAHRGGSFNNALGALRSRGWIEGSVLLNVTPAGLAALGSFTPLPSEGKDLLEHWVKRVGKAERTILAVLSGGLFSEGGTKEEIATAAGYEAKGGSFNNAIGKLRTLELIHGRGNERIQLSETLRG